MTSMRAVLAAVLLAAAAVPGCDGSEKATVPELGSIPLPDPARRQQFTVPEGTQKPDKAARR